MNAKPWMSVLAAAVIIPGVVVACAHEKAPVVTSPGAGAYWESELPRDEAPLRSRHDDAPRAAPDDKAGDAGLPGHSDEFLWDKSRAPDGTATPPAQEPLRSHGSRMDERSNTPREPLF